MLTSFELSSSYHISLMATNNNETSPRTSEFHPIFANIGNTDSDIEPISTTIVYFDTDEEKGSENESMEPEMERKMDKSRRLLRELKSRKEKTCHRAKLDDQSETRTKVTNKEVLMRNWEIFCKSILSKIFFSEETKEDLRNLNTIHHEIIYRRRESIKSFVKLVIESGAIEVCVRILKKPLEELIASENFGTFSELLLIILNTSDNSSEMGKALLSRNFNKSLTDCLSNPFFEIETISAGAAKHGNGGLLETVQRMFGILYNTIRAVPESQQIFRDTGTIEVSVEYSRRGFSKMNLKPRKTESLFIYRSVIVERIAGKFAML